MKLTKDELLSRIREKIGDDTSDEALSLIEDISDTINDYEEKTKEETEWEKKYKENDDAWRKKYKERFFNSPAKEEPQNDEPEDEENKKPLTYDNLFKE